MHHHFVEVGPKQRTKRKNIFLRILEALHRSRRRDVIRVLRRYRRLNAGQAQVRPANPVLIQKQKRAAGMPTEMMRSSTPFAGHA